MKRILVSLALVAALGACASPTPYQAADQSGRGFSENRIETNRYRVSFEGNSLTDRETVETYLLYRAAELTVEQGYDYFTVVSRATDEDTRYTGTDFGSSYYSGFPVHYAYYHPRWGWRGWHDPFWNDYSVRETTQYEASAEIVLGRGAKPVDDPHAFDAHDVIANLADDLVRPAVN